MNQYLANLQKTRASDISIILSKSTISINTSRILHIEHWTRDFLSDAIDFIVFFIAAMFCDFQPQYKLNKLELEKVQIIR